jgi:hypothetical protein
MVLRWAIRVLAAAVCYAAITTVWINTAVGWDRLNFFVAAFAFGIILLPAIVCALLDEAVDMLLASRLTPPPQMAS